MTKVVRMAGNVNPLPAKETEYSAGYDLRANGIEIGFLMIPPGESAVIGTGFKFQIPVGSMGLVLSRSGLAAKFGVFVLNAPGLIDADYRGEIKVILHNAGPYPFKINNGDRIAQLVISEYIWQDNISEVGELDPADSRGEAGFGSTGIA
jgi:dUTP pyrophosphatase